MEENFRKFKIRTCCYIIFPCIFFFLTRIALHYDILSIGSVLVIAAALLILGFVADKLDKGKSKAQMLKAMPMLISIHDTTESLKKERIIFNIIYFLLFVGGQIIGTLTFDLLGFGIQSVSFAFLSFASLTTEKIKYLENKPEGMNF